MQTFLPLPLNCWCHRCALLARGYLVIETKPRASSMLSQLHLYVYCSFIHCMIVKMETRVLFGIVAGVRF